MTAAHVEAYVADRLEISLRRHIERTSGSHLSWTPRLTSRSRVCDALETLPINLESEDPGGSEPQLRTRKEDAKATTMLKPKRSFKTFPVNVTARYLDYERSPKYIAHRQDNIERRYAALSSLKSQLSSTKQQRLATAS
ncbi:hypothetical protein PHMEG_00020205 [Phytophthora megakarya]|uniref:Uncharacterized protein n=1 Tax=Phytophthora megakarya TaxID=4795 RepID=A0A225VR80_9STRA|nr:hypothetical protein PHMEG_00020205 [Phytophthora megakarya]